jgi:two-component system, OmpR family, KDP operon response regulator KdpE
MSTNPPRILVIEDEAPIRRFLRVSIAGQGYSLVEADTGQKGVRLAAAQPPDLVVLDLGLPDLDGMEVIRQIREWSAVPILVLSARGRENDKVAALDAGADDYLTKPFGVSELMARLRVALRHAAANPSESGEPVFCVHNLRVDQERRQVFVGKIEVHLTPIEYRLLTTLIKYAGKVVTHRQLLKEVWGPNNVDATHYLRVYMGHLRHKIEADSARPRILLTEPGVGYRLAAD